MSQKIKLKTFEGIYTNADENDLNLSTLKESVNFRNEQGFLQFDPRQMAVQDLPDPDTHTNEPLGTWTWETGIFVTLTNDKFATTPLAAQYKCIILISKRDRSGYRDRMIWLKWIDETPTPTWYELSENGDIANINIPNWKDGADPADPKDFSDSLFTTDISGDIKFVAENGILKIYFPNDCFWLGRLERTLTQSYFETVTFDQFYLDRLVEPFDKDLLYTRYNTAVVFGFTVPNPNEPICAIGRRLGFSATPSIEDTQTLIVDQVDIDLSYEGTDSLNIYAFGTNTMYIYQYTNHDTAETVSAPEDPFISYPTSDSEHKYAYFYKTNVANQMAIPGWMYNGLGGGYKEYMEFQDGTSMDAQYGPVTGSINLDNGVVMTRDGGFYVVDKTTFESDVSTKGLRYIGGEDVASIGYDNSIKRVDVLVTAVLDDQEEIIIWTWGQDTNVSNAKFVLKMSTSYPVRDGNFRTTRLRYYIKITGDSDYNLVKEVNFLDTTQEDSRDFYVSDTGSISATGTTLAQNIGFLFDPERPEQYNPIIAFRDIATVAGISLGLSQGDYENVYYSVLGGGVLQTNLLYDANFIQVQSKSQLTAVSQLNNNFAAYTKYNAYVIKADEIAGVLALSVVDTLEVGVKNWHDVAYIEGGAILNTANGIFRTNGYNTQLLSKQINNICKDNFYRSSLAYNPYRHELYFRPEKWGKVYRFRFEREVWEGLDFTSQDDQLFFLVDANYVVFDWEGDRAYIQDRALWMTSSADTATIVAMFSTHDSDLGEPSIDKLINYYDVDYVGGGTIRLFADGIQISEVTLPTQASRGLNRIYVLLDDRVPCRKVNIKYVTTDTTSRFYGIEIDFDPQRYRYPL